MTETEQRNMLTGLLGTIAFHLLLLVVFLSFKMGQVKNEHQTAIEIEFAEQAYKPIEEIIEAHKPKVEPIEKLSQTTMRNIASNVAEKMNKEISTEKYIEEVMKDLGMDEINPKYDNSLPEEKVYAPAGEKAPNKEKSSANFGQTRITYNVPGRKGRHIERPIYRCQQGGSVVVKISVDQSGLVVSTQIASATGASECVKEMALESATNSTFSSDYNGPKRVTGTISYVFVAQ